MGLDIGIMSVQVLERPRGTNYRFAWELAHEASVYGVMHGAGNSVGYFTRSEVRRLVVEFARQNGLTRGQRAEVWAWAQSLPWDGDGIELYFDW